MSGIRVSEGVRDVLNLLSRITQHLPGDLEAHLLENARVRQTGPGQPALECARAGP